MDKKLLVVGVLGLFLVGCVSAIIYSNPTNQDGTPINWQEHKPPIKTDCNRIEWNDNFEKYRNNLISKEDMKSYIGGCKW